jgi:chromosome partitioning protein
MGLFNRGSKSGVPLTGDEWSTNGTSRHRERVADRTVDEHRPAPAPEQEPEVAVATPPAADQAPPSDEAAPSEDVSVPEEETDLEPEDVSAEAEAAPVEAEPTPSEPEPTPTTSEPDEPVAKAMPPANPPAPEEGDDDRISATQALAPSRRPGSGRPPGAHLGDESERRAEIISFANQKGGVAKTTTTLNLAVAFAESGHDVLVIDLDPQGNLTMSQGIDPDKVDRSMYDVLVDHIPIRDVIQDREIDIAVASIDLAGAEIAMSMQIGRERSLEKALSAVVDDYDFICIDTPPSLGLLTVNALTASDKVIVPVQCEYLSMRGLVQLQNTLEMIKENLNPRVRIEGILPTMLDSRTVHAKEAVEILEENFGELVFKSRIRKAIKFAEAPVRGSSVLKYDPKSNAAEYYRELAKEVLTNGAS